MIVSLQQSASVLNERFSLPLPVIVKYMKKNLDTITKPRYSEQILPLPWHLIRYVEVPL